MYLQGRQIQKVKEIKTIKKVEILLASFKNKQSPMNFSKNS